MRLSTRTIIPAAVVAACLFCFSIAEAKKPVKPPGGGGGGSSFQLVELQPAGGTVSSAYAISDSGIVVGTVDDMPGIWDSSETVPAFIPLVGAYGEALSINEYDEIVGWGPNGPRYWSNAIANPVELPLPTGFDSGTANGISRDGIVVGEIWGPASSGNEIWAAAWRVTEGLVFGPILLDAGGAHDVASMGAGINRAVGRSADAEFGHVATVWDLLSKDDGTFTVIGSTVLVAGVTAEAYAITNTGDVTGGIKEWSKGEWVHTAFVIRDGSFVRLPSGRRNKFDVGYDLNATDVIGQSGKVWYSDNLGATQWNLQNKHQDLMGSYFDASWTYTAAEGLNATGGVVGGGSGGAWLLRR
ncbi:hypothetical protein [Planctomycetes bacterium TBK1r]|uniref:Extracellular repeat, HAF family n=1 Tax=Stieleria magnilauensis TaxID=2527963 RepID=A0ABX5XYU3_9BACT|nr:hypothetical protein TBK1r_62420 [Planctomycetes bacterium TBK1r]